MARHIYRCALRWSDMDAFGHVNNAVYFRYLEEARIDLTFRLAPSEGDGSFSGGSVVARHEIDYLRPLVHSFEPVTVETWVERMGAGSVTYAYEIKDAERVYARATSVVVPYNLAEQRPRRLTAAEREFLEAYRDGSDGRADRDGSDGSDGRADRDGPGDSVGRENQIGPDGDPDGGRPGEAVAA